MKKIKDETLKWLKERPVVIQEAALRLFEKEELDDSDYDDLLRICGNEVGIEFSDGKVQTANTLPKEVLFQESHSHTIKITSISKIVGVNALNPKKPLILSDGLTVIYGQNGSGKTGYTRLLKQICGSKRTGDLLSNADDKNLVF